MLEDAQRKAGQSGRKIFDETLLLFATTAMLTTEQFLRENDDWEERAEQDNTCMQWKLAYKKAHSQARIKEQANAGTAKGYFYNLAAATINEKSVLQQLVLNNTTLVTSNESLVAQV